MASESCCALHYQTLRIEGDLTRIIAEAASFARKLGHTHLGLSVDPDANKRAFELNLRRNFRDIEGGAK